MKRILYIILLCLVSFFANAQNPYTGTTGYAIKQSIGSDSAIVLSKGALAGRMVIYNFADTTTANTQRIKNYPGAFIFTLDSSKLWVRNNVATQWLSAGGSSTGGDIVSFNFITDSSLIICYENGACDTIPIDNFTEIVTNIVQNFLDSSITFLNDSTIIICNAAGSCDTIDLGTSNTYYFLNDSTLVTCDTASSICVGDSCYQYQLCDTINIPKPRGLLFQNGVWNDNGIVEHGSPVDGTSGFAQLIRQTYLYTNFNNYNINGRPIFEPTVTIANTGWSQSSSSVIEFNHQGGSWLYYPDMIDNFNTVDLRLNYINKFTTPTIGTYAGDTIGTMLDRIGYAWMTNSAPGWMSYNIDNSIAKQVGIMFHTLDTAYTDAVTIFGQQVPSQYIINDSTLLSKRIAVFKTNQQVQFPEYQTVNSFPGTAAGLIGFTSEGNLITTTGIAGGSTTTILNDSTIEVCTGGVCDTLIFSDVDAQNVFVINDSTLLVCNVDNTVCDTVNIPQGFAFFDRGFFDPDQAAAANATHNAQTHTLTVTGTALSSVIVSQNTSAGIGLSAVSSSGYGLSAFSTTGVPAILATNPAATNTVVTGLNVTRNTSGGAGGDGIGVSVDFYNESSTSTSLSNQIISKFTTANHATRISQLLVTGVSAGTTRDIFAVSGTGQATLHQYGDGTFADTTTVTYLLGVQSDGDVVEVPASSLGGSEITIINDTTITICSFGDFLCDTFITVNVNPIQYVTIINDSTLQVCDSLGVCDTLNIGGGNGGFDRGFFDPNQISNADTYHQMNGYNFSLGIGLITPPSGYLNMNFLNGNTVQGNENVVFGRNMVVDGNTNFVAATDGTVTNAVNYSATFGDANDQRGTASLMGGFGNDNYVENGFVMGSDNVNGALSAGTGTANQYSNSFMIGLQNRSTGNRTGVLGNYIQNTGASSVVIGGGVIGGIRLTNSMGSVIALGTNSDSATMYVHPAAGTTGTIGKVSIGTAAPTATRFEVVDNTATTQSIMNLSSTSLSSGNGINIAIASTAATSNTQKGVNVLLSGTNANSNQATYAGYFSNTHAGTGSSNVGLTGNASGGVTVNFGLQGLTNSNVGLSAGVYALNTSNGYGLLAETSTSGTAGQGNTASGIGFQGSASSSGTGVRGNSSSGNGVQAYSITGVPLFAFTEPSSTNTVLPVIDASRRSSGTAADGIGLSLDQRINTSTTADVLAAQMIIKWTTATHASRTSSTIFNNVLAGTTVESLVLAANGSMKLRPITAAAASAITPAEGLIVIVSDTDGTFTSVGFWGYSNGAWAKF